MKQCKRLEQILKRKSEALGKKTRFEVFKRDGFKCMYCGAHPPEAILEVDHLKARGGIRAVA